MPSQGGGGWGEYSEFLYTCRLGLFFWAQNFEFQHFWGFSKIKKNWGYEDFGDYFLGVTTKLAYI